MPENAPVPTTAPKHTQVAGATELLNIQGVKPVSKDVIAVIAVLREQILHQEAGLRAFRSEFRELLKPFAVVPLCDVVCPTSTQELLSAIRATERTIEDCSAKASFGLQVMQDSLVAIKEHLDSYRADLPELTEQTKAIFMQERELRSSMTLLDHSYTQLNILRAQYEPMLLKEKGFSSRDELIEEVWGAEMQILAISSRWFSAIRFREELTEAADRFATLSSIKEQSQSFQWQQSYFADPYSYHISEKRHDLTTSLTEWLSSIDAECRAARIFYGSKAADGILLTSGILKGVATEARALLRAKLASKILDPDVVLDLEKRAEPLIISMLRKGDATALSTSLEATCEGTPVQFYYALQQVIDLYSYEKVQEMLSLCMMNAQFAGDYFDLSYADLFGSERPLIEKCHISTWRAVQQTLIEVGALSALEVGSFDQLLEQEVLSALMRTSPRTADAAMFAEKALAFYSEKALVVNLLSAFSNASYYLVNHGRGFFASPLGTYIRNLSPETIKGLDSCNVPGLKDALEIICKHGLIFWRPLSQSHGSNGSYEANPVQAELFKSLDKMALWLLEGGQEQQIFAIGSIQALFQSRELLSKADLTTYRAIEQCLQGDFSAEVKTRVCQFIYEHLRRVNSEVGLAQILLMHTVRQSAVECDMAAQGLTYFVRDRNNLGDVLFYALKHNHDAPGVKQALSQLTGISEPELLSAWSMLRYTSELYNGVDLAPYNTDGKFIKGYLHACRIEGGRELLKKFKGYGYIFRPQDVELFASIKDNAEVYEQQIKTIREWAPHFSYQPSLRESAYPQALSPYDVLYGQSFEWTSQNILNLQCLYEQHNKTLPRAASDSFLNNLGGLREQASSDSELAVGRENLLRLLPSIGHTSRDATVLNALADLMNICDPTAQYNEAAQILFECAARVGVDGSMVASRACFKPECITSIDDLKQIAAQIERLYMDGFGDNNMWKITRALLSTSCCESLQTGQALSMIRNFFREFGPYETPLLFSYYVRLSTARPISEDMQRFGILETGHIGIYQLRQRCNDFRKQLLYTRGPVDETPIGIELLSQIARMRESHWHSRQLEEIVQRFNLALIHGDIAPLKAGIVRGRIEVRRLDQRQVADFQFTQESIARFEMLQGEIKNALAITGLAGIQEKLGLAIEGLSREREGFERPLSALERLGDPLGRRAQGRQRQAAALATLSSELSHEILDSGVGAILERLLTWQRHDHPIITPLSRTILFCEILKDQAVRDECSELAAMSMSKHAVELLMNIVSNRVKDELLSTTPLSKGARSRAHEILGVRSFAEELTRLNRLVDTERDHFVLIPNRSIFAELSGQIADACWVRQSNILHRFPRISAVTIVRNEGGKESRVAGAALLIDHKNEDGDGVVIIRGLNPLQSYITRLDAGDFVEQFVEWLAPIARNLGARFIAIPGAEQQSAQSNRPDINAYIDKIYARAKTLQLAPAPENTFNSYDISSTCIVLRDLVT